MQRYCVQFKINLTLSVKPIRQKGHMTNKEKIYIKRNWQVTTTYRVVILNATYRQALSYICNLVNRYGKRDFVQKPILLQ